MSDEMMIKGLKGVNKGINDCNIATVEKYEQELYVEAQDRPDVLAMLKDARETFKKDRNAAKRKNLKIISYIKNPQPLFPPLPPYDKPVKHLCGGYLGIHLDWISNASESPAKKKDARERILDFLIHSAQLGIREIDCFWWLSKGDREHRHLNLITPWMWDSAKNKFNMEIDNEEFYDLTEEFLEMVKYAKIKPRFHGTMGQAYSEFPYTKNVQRTNGLWDSRTWPYIGHSFDRLCASMDKICGAGNYMMKIANEPAHFGDPDRWHHIMYFHEEMYEKYLKKWMPLKDIVCDRSACEGTTSELIGVLFCPKDGSSLCRGGEHGKPEYARGVLKKKTVWPEHHGFETPQDVAEINMGGWHKVILHGDGGSHTGTGEGSTWGGRTWASPEQAYEMGEHIWMHAKRYNRWIKYCFFPIESLRMVNGVVREHFDVNLKDDHGNPIWDKAEALIQAHREKYG